MSDTNYNEIKIYIDFLSNISTMTRDKAIKHISKIIDSHQLEDFDTMQDLLDIGDLICKEYIPTSHFDDLRDINGHPRYDPHRDDEEYHKWHFKNCILFYIFFTTQSCCISGYLRHESINDKLPKDMRIKITKIVKSLGNLLTEL